MGRWFRDGNWDHELDRNIERHLNEQEYWEKFPDMGGNIHPDPEVSLIEGISTVVNIIFAWRLIHKLAIKKDLSLNKEEIGYLGLFILRILMPELNIVLIFWSACKLISYIDRKVEKW